MPDESCRNCGGSFVRCAICAQCRGTIQNICVKCGTRTLEQVHSDCFWQVEIFQTMTGHAVA
ncbi:hypothetical protein SU86_005320 [Candidatus Nitrosotenuis cloacae]|uniref:Uncharacterized protein n=1 Tax=Candidatus Nitrosotenuis cloacae TaxID=1603555 RepID=A0A3G1B714_9ARCH|nr:hypothetical protein SU86_005320 [Candidatus Nitrosotenuis cloacae]